jgi:ribonuclease P protein component
MRAVPRVVNASLFKQQQEEDRKASNQLACSFSLSDANLIRSILAQKPSNTKHIAIHTLAGADGFALTVPKKLAKRAIDRNRIKRLMRESCRQNLLNLDGQLVVLRLRKKIGESSLGKLREQERCQIKAQLFNQASLSK